MALFKVYPGDKSDLPGELKDSYGYIVVDEEATAGTWENKDSEEVSYGIGEWYIDTATKRYRIAAAQLIDEEGHLYTLDDLVQKDNLVEDFVNAVWDGSSQQSRLPANDQTKIRSAIDAPKSEDAITKAINITIPAGNWQPGPTVQNPTYYSNAVNIGETLHCGAGGSAAVVPPIVIRSNAAQQDVYDLITDVVLNDAKTVLTFYIEAGDYDAVSANGIGVTVIDHR